MWAELNQFHFGDDSNFFPKKHLNKFIAILIIEKCRPKAWAKLRMPCFNAKFWVSRTSLNHFGITKVLISFLPKKLDIIATLHVLWFEFNALLSKLSCSGAWEKSQIVPQVSRTISIKRVKFIYNFIIVIL